MKKRLKRNQKNEKSILLYSKHLKMSVSLVIVGLKNLLTSFFFFWCTLFPKCYPKISKIYNSQQKGVTILLNRSFNRKKVGGN